MKPPRGFRWVSLAMESPDMNESGPDTNKPGPKRRDGKAMAIAMRELVFGGEA